MNLDEILKDVQPVNPALVVHMDGEASSVESLLGVTIERARELSRLSDKILESHNIPKGAIDTHMLTYTEVAAMSRLAKTPNELVWIGFKLGSFTQMTIRNNGDPVGILRDMLRQIK